MVEIQEKENKIDGKERIGGRWDDMYQGMGHRKGVEDEISGPRANGWEM